MEEKLSSSKRTARIAGLLYLILAITGAFSMIYVPSILIVPGDATVTVANIVTNETLFRLGILSWACLSSIICILSPGIIQVTPDH